MMYKTLLNGDKNRLKFFNKKLHCYVRPDNLDSLPFIRHENPWHSKLIPGPLGSGTLESFRLPSGSFGFFRVWVGQPEFPGHVLVHLSHCSGLNFKDKILAKFARQKKINLYKKRLRIKSIS